MFTFVSVVFRTGCILRAGAEKSSDRVGLAPNGSRVQVLETVTLEDGTVRARVAATYSHQEGWLTLADKFVVDLDQLKGPSHDELLGQMPKTHKAVWDVIMRAGEKQQEQMEWVRQWNLGRDLSRASDAMAKLAVLAEQGSWVRP